MSELPALQELIISIHALHEESDWRVGFASWTPPKFQSTLSMRRATPTISDSHVAGVISIHALHEESDARFKAPDKPPVNFNPRSP